ncbi:MAG: efflux RND transporter periplasmic adaptor subunit [Burkholderiales bacterium]
MLRRGVSRLFAVLALFAVAAVAAPPDTAVVGMQEVDQTWPAEGVVEALNQATVAAQIAGRIVETRADAGDAVVRGQVLARIDAREAAQLVASSEAQVARAEADFPNATASVERARRLVEQKFISQAALDKAQADYDAARAQVAAARAGAGQAITAKGHATITAPFSGVIAARHLQQGDMAQPGVALFTLYEPGHLRVVANVPQAKLAEVRAAGSAVVELPSLNLRIKAKSVTVLPAADARTHTTQVRLDLPGDVKDAYPGMFARAQFSLARSGKLIIPARAVVYRSEVAGTYIVNENGEIHFRQLRLGEPAGEAGVEVLAGVRRGEKVALDPVGALAQLKSSGK